MKILSKFEHKREPLPAGKISVRWVLTRSCYQAYAGREYLSCCSALTVADCLDEIGYFYELTPEKRLEIDQDYQKTLTERK